MTMTKFSRINKQREEITMRVLEDMEKGGNEWKKPWVEASPLPPHNPVSGTQYSGRNFLYTYLSGISLKFNPQDVIVAVEHATETVQAELVPYLSDSFGPDRYLPCRTRKSKPRRLFPRIHAGNRKEAALGECRLRGLSQEVRRSQEDLPFLQIEKMRCHGKHSRRFLERPFISK